MEEHSVSSRRMSCVSFRKTPSSAELADGIAILLSDKKTDTVKKTVRTVSLYAIVTIDDEKSDFEISCLECLASNRGKTGGVARVDLLLGFSEQR
ncbi:hypothetical protein [Mesorhizobium sp. M1B.F.Ca.ET.045.04.1.1]|uniref:hypothetical protein n=1 Tax=Mesorhizobium sp. M1B.F.Ca.ET.045.04.1.1 TaxID=2493673 RepID=UPI000F76351B|nr:hypothetical protein [Mesorhizobium sp. M1B.F.Ca.ET.045.04.1.1]AZO32379.1 hypothetical protein EJ071_36905 [Mesorhizobium sp. M1B.F.Ca.ET.045.04.1.1]